ncbi:MAG TPA: hypothetical protein VE974_21525 [Thermoanaerobaculia bacterium]|nr:hypothetical protein [Thermoanaerobaculia bacterium]
MNIKHLIVVALVCAIAGRAFGADEPRPERHALKEVHASSRLPRGIAIFLEIADEQSQHTAGIHAKIVFVNKGSSPVTLLNPEAQTLLLVADEHGPRQSPASLHQMVPGGSLGEELPKTTLAPGAELVLPVAVETVFSLLPEPPLAVDEQKGEGTLHAVASAYGRRDAQAIEPVAPGTYFVRAHTMLIESGLPAGQTGRIFESPAVKVVIGGGAR